MRMRRNLLVVGALAASVASAGVVGGEAGIVRYDASDYVTNGLVAHYDGISNAGLNNPHASDATGWVDLCGERNASFVDVKSGFGDRGAWLDNGYRFTGGSYALMGGTLTFRVGFTVQLVCDVDNTVQRTAYPNLLSNASDFGTFYSRGTDGTYGASIRWKVDGVLGDSRPKLDYFEGRYVTLMADSQYYYQFQTALPSTSSNFRKTRTITDVDAGPYAWTWGGASTAGPQDRTTICDVFAVRFYNRRLTDEELAWNRAVDEVRYHGAPVPVTNVVVCSSFRKLDAAVSAAAYTVNGPYTFTAPATATDANGTVYACTGCLVDTWDAEKGGWVNAGSSTGLSYDYDGGTPVRLTWQWKFVSGCVRLDADAYADGLLIAHYDGIRNVGLAVPHDSSATAWQDLVEPANTMAFRGYDDDTSAWSENGYVCTGRGFAQMVNPLGLGASFTIQVACDMPDTPKLPNKYPTVFGYTGDNCNMFLSGGTDKVNWKVDAILGLADSSERPRCLDWKCQYLTGQINGKMGWLSQTTGPGTVYGGEDHVFKRLAAQKFMLGAGKDTFNDDMDQRLSVGTFHSLRIYDRVLTDEERVWNRMVDEARFRGTVATSNMVAFVNAGPAGDGSVEVALAVGQQTFVAPPPRTVGNRTSAVAGYLVETYDETSKVFHGGVFTEGTSYAADFPAEDYASVKVVWIWRYTEGLRTAGAYDVGDYVKAGLFAHADGIRNAGADLPHDPAAEAWANLADPRNGLSFIPSANGSTSAWVDNAYRFDADAVAQFAKAVPYADARTIEMALDVDCASQTLSYPNYMSFSGDIGLYTQTSGNAITFKSPWSSSDKTTRPTFKNWDGRYLVAACDGEMCYAFQGTSYANGKTCATYDNQTKSYRWFLAGVTQSSGADARYMKGLYHAFRAYDRSLTEEEMAWNRKIDEARFHGVVATNVVVAAAKEEMSGCATEADGAYEVLGTWTFTAPAKAVGSDGLERDVRGYTLETLEDGVWSAPEFHEGVSYTHDVSAEPRPVRLTWRWKSGLMLIVK